MAEGVQEAPARRGRSMEAETQPGNAESSDSSLGLLSSSCLADPFDEQIHPEITPLPAAYFERESGVSISLSKLPFSPHVFKSFEDLSRRLSFNDTALENGHSADESDPWKDFEKGGICSTLSEENCEWQKELANEIFSPAQEVIPSLIEDELLVQSERSALESYSSNNCNEVTLLQKYFQIRSLPIGSLAGDDNSSRPYFDVTTSDVCGSGDQTIERPKSDMTLVSECLDTVSLSESPESVVAKFMNLFRDKRTHDSISESLKAGSETKPETVSADVGSCAMPGKRSTPGERKTKDVTSEQKRQILVPLRVPVTEVMGVGVMKDVCFTCTNCGQQKINFTMKLHSAFVNNKCERNNPSDVISLLSETFTADPGKEVHVQVSVTPLVAGHLRGVLKIVNLDRPTKVEARMSVTLEAEDPMVTITIPERGELLDFGLMAEGCQKLMSPVISTNGKAVVPLRIEIDMPVFSFSPQQDEGVTYNSPLVIQCCLQRSRPVPVHVECKVQDTDAKESLHPTTLQGKMMTHLDVSRSDGKVIRPALEEVILRVQVGRAKVSVDANPLVFLADTASGTMTKKLSVRNEKGSNMAALIVITVKGEGVSVSPDLVTIPPEKVAEVTVEMVDATDNHCEKSLILTILPEGRHIEVQLKIEDREPPPPQPAPPEDSKTVLYASQSRVCWGCVPLGHSSTRTVTLSTPASYPVPVRASAHGDGFFLNEKTITLAPGERQKITIAFQPRKVGPSGGKLIIKVAAADKEKSFRYVIALAGLGGSCNTYLSCITRDLDGSPCITLEPWSKGGFYGSAMISNAGNLTAFVAVVVKPDSALSLQADVDKFLLEPGAGRWINMKCGEVPSSVLTASFYIVTVEEVTRARYCRAVSLLGKRSTNIGPHPSLSHLDLSQPCSKENLEMLPSDRSDLKDLGQSLKLTEVVVRIVRERGSDVTLPSEETLSNTVADSRLQRTFFPPVCLSRAFSAASLQLEASSSVLDPDNQKVMDPVLQVCIMLATDVEAKPEAESIVLAFAPTITGSCSTAKLKMCNRSNERQRVCMKVEPFDNAFRIPCDSVEVRPRYYVRMPFHFTPISAGGFEARLHIIQEKREPLVITVRGIGLPSQ